MWTAFKRVVKGGAVGFWRNAFVSLAAIFVMMVTLFVIGGVLFLSTLLDTSLAQLQQKVDINVYFVTTAQEEDVLALKSSLEQLPEVAEVTYTSRSQALEDFRSNHEGDELTIQALEELGENPLGARLSVRARETSQYEGIASFLSAQQEAGVNGEVLIDRINYFDNQKAIDRLTSIIDGVERFGLVTMIILVAASVLITFNTLRLAIYTSREEISVMRLVGASNMFIRGPFVLQGVLYGLIAGVVVLVVLYPLLLWLGPVTEEYFSLNVFDHYLTHFGSIFLIIVGSGVALGAVSSIFAIARYLRI